MNAIGLLIIVAILLALLFGMPLWIIWTVKELFNVDWSTKYWAVFSLWTILGMLLKVNVSKK